MTSNYEHVSIHDLAPEDRTTYHTNSSAVSLVRISPTMWRLTHYTVAGCQVRLTFRNKDAAYYAYMYEVMRARHNDNDAIIATHAGAWEVTNPTGNTLPTMSDWRDLSAHVATTGKVPA